MKDREIPPNEGEAQANHPSHEPKPINERRSKETSEDHRIKDRPLRKYVSKLTEKLGILFRTGFGGPSPRD